MCLEISSFCLYLVELEELYNNPRNNPSLIMRMDFKIK